jgi:NDP-sugar pyrophosphorylase family protein
MFLVVLANLLTEEVDKVIIVAQRSFGLGPVVAKIRNRIAPVIELKEIDFLTGGPADTVDLARDFLAPNLPVVTANSDQYVDHSMSPLYEQLRSPGIAGSMLTMKDHDPKWSYVATDDNGFVTLIREKEVISGDATVGIYGFRSAALMWEGFDLMRESGDSVNGEYYVAPSYNHLISGGNKISTYDLGSINSLMHGMGTPKDYETFLRNPASIRAAKLSLGLFGAV